MKLWMSAEIQADVADAYREVRKEVEQLTNKMLEALELPDMAEKWVVIAIIREDESVDYKEVVRKTSAGKVLEFRLRIAHGEFHSATKRQRIELVIQMLLRSVDHMNLLGVPVAIQEKLATILAEVKVRLNPP